MKVLRVRIDAPWSSLHAFAWSLSNDHDEVLQEGTSSAGDWPGHDALECVVAAAHVRIVALQLPPLPPARVPAAVRFAVEDQIAGGEATTHVATSAQHDGKVLAILCPRALLEPLRSRDRALARLTRVIAEPELAAPGAEWRWCRSEAPDSGFVRLPDGSGFAVSDIATPGILPAELVIGLSNAPASSRSAVRVEWPANPAVLAQWEQQTHTRFVAGAPFDWRRASAPATLTDLMQGELSLRPPVARPRVGRMFAPALWLLLAAALLEVSSLVGDWVTLRLDAARVAREWNALAEAANVSGEGLHTPAAARAAIMRRRDQVMHTHHRFAPDDALPLLARASAGVTVLPVGSLKRATFASGHWTLEVEGASASAVGELESRLDAAGLDAMVVATGATARIRIGEP